MSARAHHLDNGLHKNLHPSMEEFASKEGNNRINEKIYTYHHNIYIIMYKKKLLSTLLLLGGCLGLSTISSQTMIDFSHNSLRAGDVLCTIETDYVQPGQSGNCSVWRLGEVSPKSKNYLKGINTKGDTISIFEKGRIVHYVTRNDTLYYKGEQEQRAYRLYDEERPVLHYPVALGDSIAGNYRGYGEYENFSIGINGFAYSVADGTGILTDGKDTLFNVSRLHLYDDYNEKYDENTVLHFQKHKYLWYSSGHRYPIMESIKTVLVDNESNRIPIDSITRLNLPSLQDMIMEDVSNDSILNALSPGKDNHEIGEKSPSGLSNLSAVLSPDGMMLTVDYTMASSAIIRIWASDIAGNSLCLINVKDQNAGDFHECITLNRRPLSGIVVLNIMCNNNITSWKVMKE